MNIAYDQLLAIAKLARVVTANIGVVKEDGGINGIYEDDFSWNGDILAGMGVSFLKI